MKGLTVMARKHLSEASGQATVGVNDTEAGAGHRGLVSVNSFDAAGSTDGFRMTFEVASSDVDVDEPNGHFIGMTDSALQSGTTFFFNENNFGLVFLQDSVREAQSG